jgi:hypothetical protein
MTTSGPSRVTATVRATLAVLAIAAASPFAHAQVSACGDLENHYGPYDYRTRRDKLGVVEKFHFTRDVEMGIRGASTKDLAGDLTYTLKASPNHHRALLALVRYSDKVKSPQPRGAGYTVDCFFDRALRFAPDDTTVRMIYAGYLGRKQMADLAIQHLDYAAAQPKNTGFTHYNLGLLYAELKAWDKARAQAHQALALGFNRTNLQDLLKRQGQWSDPPPNAASAASAAAVPAASAAAASAPASGPGGGS